MKHMKVVKAGKRLQEKTSEPILQKANIEIDEKTMPDVGKTHVGQELCLMNREQ